MNRTLFPEAQPFAARSSEIAHEASRQVSCSWSERLHGAKHLPSVCPTCVGTFRVGAFPMGPLEMTGSYPLNDQMIDEMLTRKSPGNYALGYMDGDTFIVFYVGRSDSDVRHRLHEWVGAPSGYDRYAPSTKAAWGVHQRGLLPLDVPALDHVGAGADSSYTRFAYSYAPSADAAFEKEWRNYDDFGGSHGLDNAAPPSRRRVAPGECVEHRT